jgi:hypothetical protein
MEALTNTEVKGNLTLEALKQMEPGTIFAHGVVLDERLYHKPVAWLAKRGRIHDWAIYYHLSESSLDWIEKWGDKCHTERVIKDLVSCDEEALKMYRL